MTDETKPRFTPGPWTILHEGSDMSIEPGIAYWSKHDIMGRTEDEIEGKWRIIQANADLMTAAPDMYDELKKVAWFLRNSADWIEKQHGYILIVATMRHEADRIDALLAKARGEGKK